VADTDATVLVRGETGTGKELVTRAIHEKSPRHEQSVVVVDCNIPETVAEPELFGVTANYPGFHRKEAMAGLFELADHSTLFFDEIGDLSLSIQAKILRTLQTREVRPLGAARAIPVDVRIIGATKRDLEEAIAQHQFREDLFYRFNVITIETPPLRERREDIPLLATHFFEQACTQFRKTGLQLSDDAFQTMMSYEFPGNVRELQNIIERTVLVAQDPIITSSEIMINQRKTPMIDSDTANEERDWTGLTLTDARDKKEKLYIERLLNQTQGNISEASRQAGIDRKNFRQKLSKHQIDVEQFRA
jgi:two-component system response regulator GlrR